MLGYQTKKFGSPTFYVPNERKNGKNMVRKHKVKKKEKISNGLCLILTQFV